MFNKESYTRAEVKRNIFSNPFKRFEDMRFMKKSKDIEYVEFNQYVWKKISTEERYWIVKSCEKKLEEYYKLISSKK